MRPSPLLWLRYVYLNSLPPRYADWVLHDVTCRTWLVRHTVRFLLYLTPLMVPILVFLPAPLPLRIGCVLAGVLGSIALSFGYTVEGAERRAEKAGFPYGLAERMREEAADERQRETARRTRARIALRRERRAGHS